MGPIALFDKSFLQSLNVDESVWFDHFFLCNVCPLFYVETLADLEKRVREGRTPEQEVGIIAQKFPEMHGAPCVHHTRLCWSELMGSSVPMAGQIPLAGGRRVATGDKKGVVWLPSPEADAFTRWQNGEFLEVERQHAKSWRQALSDSSWTDRANALKQQGITDKSCKTLAEAAEIAKEVVAREGVDLAFILLPVPEELKKAVQERWDQSGRQPLAKFAPYVAYVCAVDIFFELAVAAGLIGAERKSNRADIAYLYYLPFSMVFASSDRLHEKFAPCFLRPDQQFVWGLDLKEDLKRINAHYATLPEEERAKGILAIAKSPPPEGESLVAKLWDRHLSGRQDHKPDQTAPPQDAETVVAEVKTMRNAPPLKPENDSGDAGDGDFMLIERRIRRKKGSWYQVPKDLPADV